MQFASGEDERRKGRQAASAMTDRVVQGLHRIQSLLDTIARKSTVKAVVISRKRRHFCSHEVRKASFHGVEFDVFPDFPTVWGGNSAYDICILCCHNDDEEALLFQLRAAQVASVYFAWLWDNHHHHALQMRTAMLADCLFVAHWYDRLYLNHPLIFPGPHMPAASSQWSSGLIGAAYPGGLPARREDGLFGGFARYEWAARSAFIEGLMAACPDHALTLGPVEAYRALPEPSRLALWTGHKVHIIVPIARDLSTRVFDALLTGQIPLVPSDVADLDRVIAPNLQTLLPILRYQPGSIDSAISARRDGLARFDAEGAAGVARRHAFARDHHSLTNRLEKFAEFTRAPGEFALTSDGRHQYWANWADAAEIDRWAGAESRFGLR